MKQVSVATPVIYTLNGYRSVCPLMTQDNTYEHLTIAQATANYPGFKFQGPGWCEGDGYTLAVVPYMGVPAPGPQTGGLDSFSPMASEKSERDGHTDFVLLDHSKHRPEDQLWTFMSFPDRLLMDHNPIIAAFRHMANMPVHSERPRQQLDTDEEEASADIGLGPVVVQVPAGGAVRVEMEGTDGSFVVAYDLNGDGMLTVDAELPGNIMGLSGLIYVEDFNRDFTGRHDVHPGKHVVLENVTPSWDGPDSPVPTAPSHGPRGDDMDVRASKSGTAALQERDRKSKTLAALVADMGVATDVATSAAQITEDNANGAYAVAHRTTINWFKANLRAFESTARGRTPGDAQWEKSLAEYVAAATKRSTDPVIEAVRRANAAEGQLQARFPLPGVKSSDMDELGAVAMRDVRKPKR